MELRKPEITTGNRTIFEGNEVGNLNLKGNRQILDWPLLAIAICLSTLILFFGR